MSQQLVMTPQLQQAIKLLQLSHIELGEVLRQELEENPTLEDGPPQDIDLPSNSSSKDNDKDILNTRENDGMMGLGNHELPDPNSADSIVARDLEKTLDSPAGATPEPSPKEVEKDIDWEAYLDTYSYACLLYTSPSPRD